MHSIKKNNLIMTAFLIVFLLFATVLFSDDALAASIGKVDYSIGLNVRSGPGTSYSVITALEDGEVFDIVETTKDSNGDKWYKIYVNGQYGYVIAKYVIVTETPEYTYDEEFESYLTEQGFPESYKDSLRNLHASHPEWVFKAHKTNLKWSTVISKQSTVGRNLIHQSANDSYKSVEYGAYDPATGVYEIFDSGGWVSASKQIIEYYMDPRNFLTEGTVFQFMAHSYDGNTQTKKGLQTLVANTFLSKTFPEKGDTYETYSDVLMYAGQNAGANPYVLASMIITEQGSDGRGGSISGQIKGYEGYYNFFNVGAYAKDGRDAVTNGLIYASGSGSYERPWNSRVKSIIGGAVFYASEYINNKQDTLYLKKFNVMNGSSKVATHQYMTNIGGAYQEASDLKNGYGAIINSPLTFYIPVYKSMPSEPCAKPSSGSNDNYLKSLSVAGYELTPKFDYYTSDYEIIVSSGATTVDISATVNKKGAKVTGAGKVSLSGSTTKIPVTVTSASGVKRVYNITVAKEAAPEVQLTSSTYQIGEYVEGVKLKTDVTEFKSAMSVTEGHSIKVCKADGTEVTKGNVGTGMNVVVCDSNEKVVKTVTISVKGDTNGDGTITSVDPLMVKRCIVEKYNLKGAFYKASDINEDGKITSVDALFMSRHIVGKYDIEK